MPHPQYPDFPEDEYSQRYARARAMMNQQNLDALLVTENKNYIYFTGHRSQQKEIDKVRPYAFILPKDADGVMITMPFELMQVRETTWITNVRTAGLLSRADAIAEVLKDMGLSRARIGAELGREQYLNISHNEFMDLRRSFPDAEFADASQIFLTLRAIKSPREIEYIRKACHITATAMAETFASVRAGMTEIEVGQVLRTCIAHHGGERVPFMWVASTYDAASGGIGIAVPTERRLQPGDLLTLDTGTEFRGYNSDISRSASVGEPSPELAEFHRWHRQLIQRTKEQLRVGKTPSDVVQTCRELIAERNLSTAPVGRIGHGVGLETTEYPSLVANEPFIFERGVVVTCQPNFVRSFGWINMEDVFVVTDSDPERISDPTVEPEIPVIRVQ